MIDDQMRKDILTPAFNTYTVVDYIIHTSFIF